MLHPRQPEDDVAESLVRLAEEAQLADDMRLHIQVGDGLETRVSPLETPRINRVRDKTAQANFVKRSYSR
jgi:hypothetical protein